MALLRCATLVFTMLIPYIFCSGVFWRERDYIYIYILSVLFVWSKKFYLLLLANNVFLWGRGVRAVV